MMRLVITLEGGIIQRISTDDSEVAEDLQVVIADYDTDGLNPMDLSIDPRTSDASESTDFYATYPSVEYDEKEVEAIFNAKTVAESCPPSRDDMDVDGVQERIGLQDPKTGRIIGGDL